MASVRRSRSSVTTTAVSVTDTPTPMNSTCFIGSTDQTNSARPSVTHMIARSIATERRAKK